MHSGLAEADSAYSTAKRDNGTALHEESINNADRKSDSGCGGERRRNDATSEEEVSTPKGERPTSRSADERATAAGSSKEQEKKDSVTKNDEGKNQSSRAQRNHFDDEEADWQSELMEEQGNMWEGGPQEIEEKLSQIEAEAHAIEEEERKAKAAKERRPRWLNEPSGRRP